MAYDNDRFYDMETLTFFVKRSWSLAIGHSWFRIYNCTKLKE